MSDKKTPVFSVVRELTDEELAAAHRLASVRGEEIVEILDRFSRSELKRCPRRFNKHIGQLRSSSLESTGCRDGLAYVTLTSGRIFYSYLTTNRLRREYQYIADVLPECITEDTYLAAIDVIQRYVTDYAWPPEELINREQANIVELGAYLGHKTIRFAEELVGKGGKVLAVEMMPDNCELLRRNVVENGFGDIVDVLEAGVWSESGTVEVYSKGRQRNSILPFEKLKDGKQHHVEVQSLDEILDEWGVKPVDLVFITVNGVEIEALQGFHPEERDVQAVFVAAPYSRDGCPTYKVCRELLMAHGYWLLDVGNPRRVVGTRERIATPPPLP